MSILERVIEQTRNAELSLVADYNAAIRKNLKQGLVDRLGLSTLASLVGEHDEERLRTELSAVCQALLNTHEYAHLSADEKEGIVREVLDEVIGLGPLQPLLDNADITEVMVNGCSSLFYEQDGTLFSASRVFENSEQIMTVLERILAPLGRRLDERSPIVNARLANGDRVNAIINPIALDGPIVTIRKFSGEAMSLEKLCQLGSLPQWYAQLLRWAVKFRCDIAVAGGTGSGKTTLLNALSVEIPHTERIITIEDSAELRFDTHPHVVRLESRDASIENTGQISIRDLVKNALRMRPDRIIVGEVRSEEAIDMLQAMNTGHDGSLTTLHAGSPQEAILRLVLMARFGMDLPADIIEEQIASALDLVVMSQRLADGSRIISTLSQVSRSEMGGVDLQEIISFDQAARRWTYVQEPAFLVRAIQDGLISQEEVRAWRQQQLQVA